MSLPKKERDFLWLKQAKEMPTWKKYGYYTFLSCVGYMLIFRPERIGTIIGTWLHDFFGSLLHAL